MFSAYLGPGYPTGIAVDGVGSAYVAGIVSSSNFPVTSGAYETSYPGGFLLKTNNAGALIYSTYLSGPSGYQMINVDPRSVAIPPGCTTGCTAYVAGDTTTSDFPLISPIQSFAGNYGLEPSNQEGALVSEGFLVEVAPSGKTSPFSTYLGGASSPTTATSIAVDGGGNMYFAGNVEGSDAPATLPAVQDPGYGYLAKISPANAGLAAAIPNQVVFDGLQPVNATTSTGGTVELRNLGSAAITLTRPFAFSSAEFAETDDCPATLPGGGLCTLNVSFTPAASGPRSGTLSIASSGKTSPAVVALSGTGTDAPDLQISTTYLSFADQVVSTASAAQVVTLTNTGDEAQPITSISTGGVPDFKATTNCPAQLGAGSSCQVSVAFSPSQIGLLTDDLYVQLPVGYDFVALEGTGVVAPAGTGSVQFSPTSLSFGSIVLGQNRVSQIVTLMNTGNAPVTVTALSITQTAGKGNSGDFALTKPAYEGSPLCLGDYLVGNNQPYDLPLEIEPQGACAIFVTFQPSIAGQEAATLTVSDSAVGSPHTLGLSGIGLNAQQPLTISPSTMTFAAQPLGDPSAAQTFTVTNPGDSYVAIDRVFTTGDFGIATGNNCEVTLNPQASCTVSVQFDPTATGARTGTLTLTDSISGTPSVFNLAGTGIAATGALTLGQPSLTFASQNVGTTSESEELVVSNPGNSPVTINSVETSAQFAVIPTPYYYDGPQNCIGAVAPGATCSIEVAFSPSQSSGEVTGSLIIHSTAGTLTAALSGTATESAQAIHITPTTINFGSAVIGGTTTNSNETNAVTVYIDNTGGAPVTFATAPTITGVSPAPGADFQLADSTCYQYLPLYANSTPAPMPPGGSCSFKMTFVPSLSGTEKATFALTDSAGKQTIAMSGVGTTTSPAISLYPPVMTFDQLAVGASTIYGYQNEILVYNSGSQPVTIKSAAVSAGSADFSIATSYSYCTGYTLNTGSACDVAFIFHPSAVGYRTGTVTFTDSLGNQYTAALAGYGDKPVDGAELVPQSLIMPTTPVQTTASGGIEQDVTLNNTGNTPLTIGTITGTNVASGDDFPALTGYVGCNGSTVQPGSSCSIGVPFEPQATGQRTGSLTFPIRYADGTTSTLTAKLSGSGVPASLSATLSPSTVNFGSAVAGTTQFNYQNSVSLVLRNTGNESLTVGTATGSDLTTTAGSGGDFYEPYGACAYYSVSPGGSCTITIYFEPLTPGPKTGSISVPVTYSGGTTATFTSTFSGQGVAQAPAVTVNPTGMAFNPEVAGTTDSINTQGVTLTSTGNANLAIKSITASPNFRITTSQCNSVLQNPFSCTVTVAFAPLASTAAGNVTGTLTIIDNAPNSPQVVQLSGKVISASQELSLSQATVTFANQSAGTASPAQTVYLTDLGPSGTTSQIQINSVVLGGADPGDFTETQTCGGSLGFTVQGRATCEFMVAFAPGVNSFGARTATVTITPAKGPALVITLKGNAYGAAATLAAPAPGTVLSGPEETFSWTPETGASGYALHLGTAAGGANVYNSGEITATSAKPTTLPTTGKAIYATLITYYGTVTVSNSYTFTEATSSAIATPTSGGTLASPSQTFAWTQGVGATSWSLQLGSEGRGSSDLYSSGNETSTSVTVPGLPATGGTVYARLTTNFHGASVSRDYTFAAAQLPVHTTPVKLPVAPALEKP